MDLKHFQARPIGVEIGKVKGIAMASAGRMQPLPVMVGDTGASAIVSTKFVGPVSSLSLSRTAARPAVER
jgi:hypothetical protein